MADLQVPGADLRTFTADAVAALAGDEWLHEARMSHWECFQALPLPTTAEEMWRYSRIDDLDLDRYRPLPSNGTGPEVVVPPEAAAVVESVGHGATVVVVGAAGGFGVLRPGAGVVISAAGEDVGLFGESSPSGDPFCHLNAAFAPAPLVVAARDRSARAGTVVVVHSIDRDGFAYFPRLLVDAAPGTELSVLEVLCGPDVDALVVPYTELRVGDDAHVRYAQIQVLGPRCWQIGQQTSTIGRDATSRSMTIALGGSYARVRADSRLTGQGGDSQLLATYFGSGDQMHDLRTVQHHSAPRSTSDLLFKGMVAEQAHSVYSGLIRVDKGARGTNAFQTNRNLVLSEGAHADSVPNLEIEDNDVHCSHASAVGPIDEEQRFYLESRGVPASVAERLIALGFVGEVLLRFPVPGLLEWLRQSFANKLDASSVIRSGSAGTAGAAS